MSALDSGRYSVAAGCVGVCQGSLDHSVAYSKEREQFGKPIASFQAMQFALAEMATRIAASEVLLMAAAVEMDRTGQVTLKASEAKLMTGETAVFCAERGVQIHGGYGFVKDYRAEKFYRDSKICTIGEGTSEIQRLVIARQLLQQ
jgi:alkylation response protein AidB-like acyl-CoA dehydrogenase